MDEIIVPLYDESDNNDYRLFYSKNRFEIEEYENGSWVPTKKDPDKLLEQIEFIPDSIVKFAAVLNSIKPEYHNAVLKYDFRKVSLLSIIHRSPEFLEILNDSPALGLLIADSYANGSITLSDASDLVNCSRTKIVNAIGGNGTKSQVKILSKIRISDWNGTSLLKIRKYIIDSVLNFNISKIGLKFIDEDLINLINENNNLLNFASLRNYIKSYYGYFPESYISKKTWKKRIEDTNQIIKTIQNFLVSVRALNIYKAALQKSSTYEQLYYLQFRIEKKYLFDPIRAVVAEYKTTNFPSPPIAENENIIAITNLENLIKEGYEMNNCVQKYAKQIFLGEYYLYKVLRPERATLGIKIESEYRLIDQLYLFDNKKASNETWDSVKKWFESNTH